MHVGLALHRIAARRSSGVISEDTVPRIGRQPRPFICSARLRDFVGLNIAIA